MDRWILATVLAFVLVFQVTTFKNYSFLQNIYGASEVCAVAVFDPQLPLSFKTGTSYPFTVSLGKTFSSISQVTAHSYFAEDDTFGSNESYFIDNFGGQKMGETGGTASETYMRLTSIDPIVLAEFKDGLYEGKYISEAGSFTLTKLLFCAVEGSKDSSVPSDTDLRPVIGSFRMTDAANTPVIPKVGEPLILSQEVQNGGTATVTFETRFQFFDPQGNLVNDSWISATVAPGQVVRPAVSYVPKQPGTHKLILTIDFMNKVQETDENNNVQIHTFGVIGSSTIVPTPPELGELFYDDGTGESYWAFEQPPDQVPPDISAARVRFILSDFGITEPRLVTKVKFYFNAFNGPGYGDFIFNIRLTDTATGSSVTALKGLTSPDTGWKEYDVSDVNFVSSDFYVELERVKHIRYGDGLSLDSSNAPLPAEKRHSQIMQNGVWSNQADNNMIRATVEPFKIPLSPPLGGPGGNPLIDIEIQPGSANAGDNKSYNPKEVTVAVGATVEWVNKDSAGHTVTSGNPGDSDFGAFFDSAKDPSGFLIKPGDVWKYAFHTAGVYPYFCQVHPWMLGKVTVKGTSGGQITVRTDKSSYTGGEIITISGTVPAILEGVPVYIQVFNPDNQQFTIIQATPNADGTYSTTIKVGGHLGISGIYTVKATYSGESVQTTFEFKGADITPGMIKVEYKGKVFYVKVSLSNGSVSKIGVDERFTSLLISVSTTGTDGTLYILLPRTLIDAKATDGRDTEFHVLVDGEETRYKEDNTTLTERTLIIPVPAGSETIEIVGTQVLGSSGTTGSSESKIMVDRSKYTFGQDILITGKGFPEGKVGVLIVDPQGKEVSDLEVTIDVSGSFSLSVRIEEAWQPGEYDVAAVARGVIADTSFTLEGRSFLGRVGIYPVSSDTKVFWIKNMGNPISGLSIKVDENNRIEDVDLEGWQVKIDGDGKTATLTTNTPLVRGKFVAGILDGGPTIERASDFELGGNVLGMTVDAIQTKGPITPASLPEGNRILSIDASTDVSAYFTGQDVVINGMVLSNGDSVSEANVNVKIINPLGKVVHDDNIMTDDDGNFNSIFILGKHAYAGEYTVKISSSKAGYFGDKAVLSFKVFSI